MGVLQALICGLPDWPSMCAKMIPIWSTTNSTSTFQSKRNGDAWARTLVRRHELMEEVFASCVRWLKFCPTFMALYVRPSPIHWHGMSLQARPIPGLNHQRVNSAISLYLMADPKPYRVHVRGPSSMHAVQVLEKMSVGSRIEDIAQTMFSLDACPPEVDR